MTIKEILVRALGKIFSEEIDHGYYLLVLTAHHNILTASSSYVPLNFSIKGQLERPNVLSSVSPDSIEGITIISSDASYWFKIINNDCFEIRCCSNLMGRSGATLLEIQRTGEGNWLAKNGMPLDILTSPGFFIMKKKWHLAFSTFLPTMEILMPGIRMMIQMHSLIGI